MVMPPFSALISSDKPSARESEAKNELKDAIDGKILVRYREDKGSSLEVIA